MELFKLFAVCILSYLLGSVTFATIVSKVIAGKDIRTLGNHNAGMSNMIVSVGAKPGIITFLGDFGKGVLSVLLAFMIFGFGETKIGVLAALCAMLRHLYPVFFGFRWGKGTAVMGGAILAIRPLLFLVIIAVFLIILFTTKYIALSTIVCSIIYPVWMGFDSENTYKGYIIVLCICVTILSVSKHIENIYKIKNGEEIKFSPGMFKKGKVEKT